MYQGKRIIAIIPARAGSKGIKDKNIRDLCGKPLLAYSVEVAAQCDYIDEVFVSTDSTVIQQTAQRYGADVPFLRSRELASDEAKIIDALLFTLDKLKEQGQEYDYVMLLQPTQPIRTVGLLREIIEKMIDEDLESLVTICPVEECPILMRTMDEQGRLTSILHTTSTVRRQDFPTFYKVNGSVYMNKINGNFNKSTSLNDNAYGFVMPTKESIDIDTMRDFEKAKQYIRECGQGDGA